MADKVFTVKDLLPLGVSPKYTTFLGSKGKMSSQEVVETQSIASLHIHVESMEQYSTIHNVWCCKSNVVSVCYVM